MLASQQVTFSVLFFVASVILSVVVVPVLLETQDSSFDTSERDVPLISQNLHKAIVRLINKNVVMEHFEASYNYLAMASYFDRSDVALPGFAKYFRKLSNKERENANSFMAYINKRGGYTELRIIREPARSHWSEGLDAMYDALEIQKSLNDKLLHLHRQASKHGDPHLTYTLEEKFLDAKVKLIKEMGDHITNLRRMIGEQQGLGEYIFDKNLE